MSEPDEAADVTVRVARALERAGIEYLVGGSVASSSHGEPRATRDVDFAIRLVPGEVRNLVQNLGPDFAVDEEMIEEAVRTGRSANVFYLPVFMKIDFFMRGADAYDRTEFARGTSIEPVPGEVVRASSPEDNLLWKLRWFRMGGEVSDQQWRDVLGLLRVGGDRMDRSYLQTWAAVLGVADLLERAVEQSRR